MKNFIKSKYSVPVILVILLLLWAWVIKSAGDNTGPISFNGFLVVAFLIFGVNEFRNHILAVDSGSPSSVAGSIGKSLLGFLLVLIVVGSIIGIAVSGILMYAKP